MADNKGGSDLDVFEGLTKKPTRASSPSVVPPPPSAARAATLIGVPVPPPSGRMGGSVPPPPPSKAPPAVNGTAATLQGVIAPPARLSSPSVPPPPPPGSIRPTMPSIPSPPVEPAIVEVHSPNETNGKEVAVAESAVSVSAATQKIDLPEQAQPKPSIQSTAAVDMDWDDDQESTQVYDRNNQDVGPAGPRPAAGQPAAVTLMASSGGAAIRATMPSIPAIPSTTGPAMPMAIGPGLTPLVPSVAPPPPPVPSMPPMQSYPPPAQPSYHPSMPPAQASIPPGAYPMGMASMPPLMDATSMRPRASTAPTSGGSKAGVILGALALVAVLALALFTFWPKKGSLRIDVKSRSGAPVARAEIFVDGQKKCDAVPCVVTDLEPGTKAVKVLAPDFATPDTATETVEPGRERAMTVFVDSSASALTGFKATGGQQGVKVYVDDVDNGPLPVEVKNLKPGVHKIRFDGGPRYDKIEQTFEAVQGQVKDLGAVRLKVLKGQLALDLMTPGATVTLTSLGAKHIEQRLNDSVWKKPPVFVDVDASESWRIVATKKGYLDYAKVISFDDAQAQQSVRIELELQGNASEPVSNATATSHKTASSSASNSKASSAAAASSSTPSTAPSGNGTLNMNSIPVSKVVLDGKPLGSTPKVGVSVNAGSHTVVFIHPDFPKKTITVDVKAGETKTAAVKFK